MAHVSLSLLHKVEQGTVPASPVFTLRRRPRVGCGTRGTVGAALPPRHTSRSPSLRRDPGAAPRVDRLPVTTRGGCPGARDLEDTGDCQRRGVGRRVSPDGGTCTGPGSVGAGSVPRLQPPRRDHLTVVAPGGSCRSRCGQWYGRGREGQRQSADGDSTPSLRRSPDLHP